jgi:hypothetical protein
MEGGKAAAHSRQMSLFGCTRVESSYQFCYPECRMATAAIQLRPLVVALQVGSSAPRPDLHTIHAFDGPQFCI